MRAKAYWEYILTPEEWLRIALSRDAEMFKKGYIKDKDKAREWRKYSPEARRQAKKKRSLLGGRKGPKPWIYPHECYRLK